MKKRLIFCLCCIGILLVSGTPLFTQTVRASEDIEWSWANPYPIGSELSSIVYADGKFVAVGSDGVIISSIDGQTWEIQQSGTSGYLAGVAYLDGKYWSVGNEGVLSSPDGVNWTNPNTGMGFYGRGIEYNGSRYVVASSSSIRYSDDDGAVWNLVNLGTIFGWSYRMMQDIVWDGSRFVVVGDSGTVVTSQDGVNWTEQTSTVTAHLRAITFNSDMFIAVGNNGTIITSPDGINWEAQTSGTASGLQDIVWDGSQFVAVGNPYGEYFCILTSLDGINWVNHNNPSFRLSLSGVAWNGSDTFVAVGFNGSIVTSNNGADWGKISHGTVQNLKGVVWGGNQYVAVGINGAIVASSDGYNWTEHNLTMANIGTLTLIPELKAVTWGNDLFVAVGNWIIVTSPDGVNWTNRWASPVINFRDVIWAGDSLNLFIAAGPGNKVSTSPDGITWTEYSIGLPAGQRIDCIAWNGSRLAASGGGSSIADRFVATSEDAVSWNITYFNSGFNDIIWDGSRFIGAAAGSWIYTSPDGDIWTRTSAPAPSSELLFSLVWDDNQYTAVGRVVLHSSDGDLWIKQSMPTANELWGISWNGHGQCVAVGDGGTILVSGDTYIPTPEAPVSISAVTDGVGSVILITFDKTMADPAGKHGQFVYRINGGDVQNFSSASLGIDDTIIDLTVDGEDVVFGDMITVSYTPGDVLAADGGILETFTDLVVVNNISLPPTSDALIDNLVEEISNLDIPAGTMNSLTSKLDAALKILAEDIKQNDVAAANILKAFINSIEAQRGKKISVEDADALIAKAEEIIASLG